MLNREAMPGGEPKTGMYWVKERETYQGQLKTCVFNPEKVHDNIQSPYLHKLVINGLAQHNLKHN